MRLLALLVLALAIAMPVSAQDATNGTTDGTAAPTPPPTGETPTGETPAGETPAAPEPITIELEGVQEGSSLFFRKVGETARNPTLQFAPGQKVTFVFRVVSGVHNLNINNQVKTDVIGADAGPQTLEWTAPESGGPLQYWCDPHKSSGMQGRIQVGTAAPPTGGGGDAEEIAGPTVDLGQYDPNCAGKVAPASAANGEVGMPTIQDYVDRLCKSSDGETATAADPYKSADYVIPISWALIGLGVVGVVWVHKFYKP